MRQTADQPRVGRARRRPVLAVALAAVLGLAPSGAGPAAAALPRQQPLSITYVARVCDEYTDVMANKARNNLQESLRDLGPDSTYAAGDAVTVAAEAEGSPGCRPLPGWRFSTGTGIAGPAVRSEYLSTVTGGLRSDIVTQDAVQERDAAGRPTGSWIEGAVTVQLDAGEQGAARGNRLWVQGGTPDAPLNGRGEELGFAALRCARDAVNGDNVETVVFPTDARHVLCYYYAVSPPPTAGTITVRKELAAGSSGAGDFRFDGNVSYADADGDGVGDLTLRASDRAAAQMTFVRGAGSVPWTFAERASPGWVPSGPPVCTATNAEGPATSTFEIGGDRSVAVTLAAGDDVVCTFTNARTVTGGAVLRKETLGGTGTFAFELTGQSAPPAVALVTTTQPGVPETAIDLADLPPDTYTATEVLPPPTPAGSWELEQASCNGEPLAVTPTGPLRRSATVTLVGGALDCVATNRFRPGGSISVTKTSVGGTGTFDFLVTPQDDVVSHPGTVTTTQPDVPAPATPDGTGSGPLVDGLVVDPATTYTVTELLPASSDTGYWELVDADCGPTTGPLDVATASVEVTLTLDAPDPTCAFVNRFVPWGTVEVVKSTSPDPALRPSPAVLALVCAGGTPLPLEVPAGTPRAAIPQQTVTVATTCVLTEPATGARDGVEVTTTARITVDGVTRPLALGEEFALAPARAVLVEVGNVLVDPVAPPTPTPTPTPPTGPPTGPPPATPPDVPRPPVADHDRGTLADTGTEARPLGVAAAWLLAAGTLLLVGVRRATRPRR